MNTETIDFKKQRNFGDNLNATFAFLKQNFIPLFKCLVLFAGPFILVAAIIGVLMQSYLYDVQSGMMSNAMYYGNASSYNPFEWMMEFMGYYFLTMVFYLIGYTTLVGTLYSYITLYIENGKDGFTMDDVRRMLFSKFLSILGTSFVVGLLVVVGTAMCCLPGIYLSTSLSVIVFVLVYEKTSFGKAFSRSFSLTHKDWWWTLLLLIVTALIVYAVSMAITLPAMIVSGFSSFNWLQRGGNPMGTATMILTVISSFLVAFLYVIPFTSYVFQYFNIVEKHENPSLLDKIDSINEN